MATWEAQVQRFTLALTVTLTTLCWGSVTHAQVLGATVCQPLPSWYPRGWELMVRYPCVTYVYGSSYHPATYNPYPGGYPYRRVSTHAVQRVHRRPYLRPGWWWSLSFEPSVSQHDSEEGYGLTYASCCTGSAD